MIQSLATRVTRWRLPIIIGWLVLALGLLFFAPALSDVADYSSQGFLPKNVDSKQAEKALNAITGDRIGLSSLVLVVHRDSGLTAADEGLAKSLAGDLGRMGPAIQTVVDPWQGPEHRAQLLDPKGQTALIVLGLADTAYARSMPQTVLDIRQRAVKALGDSPIQGLKLHLTGEAAFSTDEHLMVKDSMNLITAVTVVLVLAVLIIILRSPFAPILPLAVIGLSFLISRGIIGLLSLAGLAVSAYTETFLIAVLFGAGTDYALLMVSRYKDELNAGKSSAEALSIAVRWSSTAILSSATASIVGFLSMGLAVFGLYNSTGPSVAIGVVIALALVLTLTPALLSLFGPRIFWPRRPGSTPPKEGRLWPRLAGYLTKRPWVVLAATLAIFVPSLISSLNLQRSFDMVSELPPYADSRQGFELISRDFGIGELMPVKLIIQADKDLWGLKALPVIDDLAEKVGHLPDVVRVRTATRPSGVRVDRLVPDLAPNGPDASKPLVLPKIVIAAHPELKAAMETFIAADGRSLYLDIVLGSPPYARASIDSVDAIRTQTLASLQGTWLEGSRVAVGGATAMFADLRQVTASDFTLVMILVLAGVFIVLVFLLRSLVAPAYLLLTILLSFVSTMGLSELVFQGIFHYEGVNWAVQFFAFCILVALGVDYNIFLMARVREEYQPGQMLGAIQRSLVGTGKIITSCGLIMAGCFGAMMLSPMRSIQEVGFATVTGLLIDTFIIRSLMVPSIAVLFGEANWWPWRRRSS